jgi:hypothetical protein
MRRVVFALLWLGSRGAVVLAADPSPAAAGTARASGDVGSDLQGAARAPILEAVPAETATRPRFSFAVGAGASVDHSGLVGNRNVVMPAFHVLAGVGEARLGFEASLMATQASGRYRRIEGNQVDIGVDRAAVDVLLALRPFAPPSSADVGSARRGSSLERLRRSLTLDLGGAIERVAPSQDSAYRAGAVVGIHADVLTLTDPSQGSSLALRIGARRLFAARSTVSTVVISDTVIDTFVSLAAGF